MEEIRHLGLRLSDPVLAMLKKMADREHRSMNQQVVHLIITASQQAPEHREGTD